LDGRVPAEELGYVETEEEKKMILGENARKLVSWLGSSEISS
jgi:hypothetical protein